MNKIAHDIIEDGKVLVVLRPQIGAPSSLRIDAREAARFARALLNDMGVGDGIEDDEQPIEIGPMVIDASAMRVEIEGRQVPMSRLQLRILETLALRAGLVVSKSNILNRIYTGRVQPEPKIIDVVICRIRSKLREAGVQDCIQTVWGVGYRLSLPTEPVQ